MRPDGPPTASPWEVVIPRTRTGRESTNCQATDSRQRCDFKLKARRARTEAEKVPPPATPLQYSSPVVPRQTSQAGKVLADSAKVGESKKIIGGLGVSAPNLYAVKGRKSESELALNVVVRIELTIPSEIPRRVRNVFACTYERKTCTCTPTFPVAIRSDSFATDCTRLKKFGREV